MKWLGARSVIRCPCFGEFRSALVLCRQARVHGCSILAGQLTDNPYKGPWFLVLLKTWTHILGHQNRFLPKHPCSDWPLFKFLTAPARKKNKTNQTKNKRKAKTKQRNPNNISLLLCCGNKRTDNWQKGLSVRMSPITDVTLASP